MKININHTLKKYQFNSLLFGNFVKICIFAVILLGIATFLIYSFSMRFNTNEMILTNKKNAEIFIENTIGEVNKVWDATAVIAIDTDVKNYIISENPDIIMPNLKARLNTKIKSYSSFLRNLHSIYFYSKKTNMVYSKGQETQLDDFSDISWLDAYNENNKRTVFCVTRRIENIYPNVISFICDVQGAGCVVVNMDIYQLSKTINSKFLEDMDIYMLDKKNSIMYSNDESWFMKEFDKELLEKIVTSKTNLIEIDKSSVFAFTKYYDKKGWQFIVTSIPEQFIDSIIRLKKLFFFIIFALFVLIILASIILAVQFYEPVSEILEAVGNESEAHHITSKSSEVGEAISKIVRLTESNAELKNELTKRMMEYHNLQFLALQSQINPHFLNNTLNMISLKMATEHGLESESLAMINSLTRVTRHVFRNAKFAVGFKEEIDFLHSYIGLLKKRYTNVTINMDIDEGVYKYKILNMCMQPLIENAFFHGVGAMRENGYINVTIAEKEDDIVIEIYDNGKGISEEKINEILHSMDSNELSKVHVGLKNVARRLDLMYGGRVSFKIESKEDEFTKITIKIPKMENE